jgi:predicted transcriptional regulator
MPPRLTESDVALLFILAEHRILTVEQLSVLTRRNAVSVQRRLGQLLEAGLVVARTREHGRQRGRPQNIFALS